MTSKDTKFTEDPKKVVAEFYSGVAKRASSCCSPSPQTVARVERLYANNETQGLPQSVVDASAGCGNPLALSKVRPGDTVLDLGSGGGIDCFVAAKAVGPNGMVIGVDMTPDMIRLARENTKKLGATNVEFRLGEIEVLPVSSQSVDLIISNCVINLSPDKDAVFREAFRVLKPGGQMVVSDIVLSAPLPENIAQDRDKWAACIGGAIQKDDYVGKMMMAGFFPVKIEKESHFVGNEGWKKNVVSAIVVAHKPIRGRCC